MLHTAVTSSNVKEVAWKADCLYVRFVKNDRVWRYDGVPVERYNEMIDSESCGRYLNTEIIPNYPCQEVEKFPTEIEVL
jgi:hypothetical protein